TTICWAAGRLLQVPTDMQWEVKRYEDHTLHLINTDIDDLLDIDDARIAKEAEEKKKKEEEAATAAAAAGGEKASPDVMDVAGEPHSQQQKQRQQQERLGRYHALCIHFTLPAAAYATMCLREITRQDTSTSFHTSLNALAPGQ
ncbi:unnamed protein product, partial [Hapterophycus canaliculatus]